MKKLAIILTVFVLIASISYGQNTAFITAKNSSKYELKPGFYLLSPDSSATAGFNLYHSKEYYFIKVAGAFPLSYIDTAFKDFNTSLKVYMLEIRLNPLGKKLFSEFTEKYEKQKVGLIVNDQLLLAATIFEPIDGGGISVVTNLSEADLNVLIHELLSLKQH